MLYANVAGERRRAFPKGRATCPGCGGVLIAKCGPLKTDHWAHQSGQDCDDWSEPIGPWHLWWQDLVRPQSVEVSMGPHRADIMGNGGVVVELQHSPISPEDIEARESFYGNMVWLFDATQRFSDVKSGDRCFFSFGRTKHIDLCKKPVFLDFGFDVVEVEQFTDAVSMVSGFGLVRSREWFADAFLSDVRRPDARADAPFVPDGKASYPWAGKSPLWRLKEDTKWIDPASGRTVTYKKWTEYIWLRYGRRTGSGPEGTVWDYQGVIDRHPEIANGWTKDGIRQMKDFFYGKAIILGGLLRVLPFLPQKMAVNRTVGVTEQALQGAEEHIKAGRLPVLAESEKQRLIELAKQYEIGKYGRTIRREPEPDKPKQKSLID